MVARWIERRISRAVVPIFSAVSAAKLDAADKLSVA